LIVLSLRSGIDMRVPAFWLSCLGLQESSLSLEQPITFDTLEANMTS